MFYDFGGEMIMFDDIEYCNNINSIFVRCLICYLYLFVLYLYCGLFKTDL